MNKRLLILPLLFSCCFFTTSCSESTKNSLAIFLYKLIKPEEYKLFESTNALIDYVNAKTKNDEDLIFIHSSDDFEKWMVEVDQRTHIFTDSEDSPEATDENGEKLNDLLSHRLWDWDDEKTLVVENNVYSGVYWCGSIDKPAWFFIPFSALVVKGDVKQFNEADADKITVFDLRKGTWETKVAYEERLRKEEERARLAAQGSALSGSGLGQIGANYLLSSSNNIIQVISYRQAAFDDALNKTFFGQESVTYVYKVLEANGFGTNTNEYDVVFRNGNVVYAKEHTTGIDDTMGTVVSSLSPYLELLNGMK